MRQKNKADPQSAAGKEEGVERQAKQVDAHLRGGINAALATLQADERGG